MNFRPVLFTCVSPTYSTFDDRITKMSKTRSQRKKQKSQLARPSPWHSRTSWTSTALHGPHGPHGRWNLLRPHQSRPQGRHPLEPRRHLAIERRLEESGRIWKIQCHTVLFVSFVSRVRCTLWQRHLLSLLQCPSPQDPQDKSFGFRVILAHRYLTGPGQPYWAKGRPLYCRHVYFASRTLYGDFIWFYYFASNRLYDIVWYSWAILSALMRIGNLLSTFCFCAFLTGSCLSVLQLVISHMRQAFRFPRFDECWRKADMPRAAWFCTEDSRIPPFLCWVLWILLTYPKAWCNADSTPQEIITTNLQEQTTWLRREEGCVLTSPIFSWVAILLVLLRCFKNVQLSIILWGMMTPNY